jgi:hypothetical protein
MENPACGRRPVVQSFQQRAFSNVQDVTPPPQRRGFFRSVDAMLDGMPGSRRPEPNWRLLVIVLCWGIVLAALGLLLRWWGF